MKRIYKNISHISKQKIREEVQDRSKKLADTLPKYNGLACLREKTDLNATHWLAEPDENSHDGITVGQLYRLYWDEYESEHVIRDDRGQLCVPYLSHNGVFVILEGSNQWHDYVENLWRKEWRETDEYKEMMRQSMEAMRQSEMEDD